MPSGIRKPGWNISSYSGLIDALGVLYTDNHQYKTLVIDTLTKFEQKLLFKHVIDTVPNDRGEKVSSIEGYGYGAGYKHALPFWEEIFEGLESLRRDRNMTIMLIGHSVVKNFKDPENPAYDIYDLELQDSEKVSAARFVKERSDAVFFIKRDVNAEKEDPKDKFNKRIIAKGTASRWINTEWRPAFSAKNRYGMPDRLPYRKGCGFVEIARHIPSLSQHVEIAA